MHGNVMWLMVTVRRSAEGAAVSYGSPERRRRGRWLRFAVAPKARLLATVRRGAKGAAVGYGSP